MKRKVRYQSGEVLTRHQQQRGPSQQVQQGELNNSNAQTQISQQEEANSTAALQKSNTLEQPAINLYTALTTGSPTAQMTAAAPVLGQISSGYQASKDSIFNNIAPGAGRDYALSQLDVQSNAAKSSALSNVTSSAFDKLANLGAGYGALSLQQIGASLSGLSGSSSSLGQLGNQQEQGKASTMGFLGALVGGGSQVGAAALGG